MKKSFLFIVTVLITNFCRSQTDSAYYQFIDLVKKVQNDKSLRGTFMYKGYKVNIGEYTELRTTIGKYIQIDWRTDQHNNILPYKAIFHNTLGYMTRSLFGVYARAWTKEYKTDKNKYCKESFCVSLLTDQKLPYFVVVPRQTSDIKEIK